MKRYLILLFFCCAVFLTSAQDNDWKQLNLKGKVKSLTSQETYRYKQGGVWRDWEKTYRKIHHFNSKGGYMTYQEYGLDGKLSYTLTYTYLPKEKKKELSYVNRDGLQTAKTVQLLDANGKMVEEIKYGKGDTLYMRYVYTYDDKGSMLTMTGYKPDGRLTSTHIWTNDSKGRPLNYKIVTPGYANSSSSFMYDTAGNNTEYTQYNGDGVVQYRFEREYDKNGNKIVERKYKGGNELRSTIKWRYEFDKAGNWTRKTESSEADDFHVEERTITYY